MAEVAEVNFNRIMSTFIKRTRPQSFRSGKPPRYPQRSLATVVNPQVSSGHEQESGKWQQHALSSVSSESSTKPRLDKLRSDLESRPFSSYLTDNYAREHNYLRISVTERCNLRCLYCMPEEGVPLSPPAHNLTTPEIVYLSSLFVNQGVDKIRLTGGEPTVRKDIVELMRQIGNLRKDGLKELCLTTNGISLHRKLDAMVESGLTGVNLSLDTLDPFQFTIMTRRNGHEAVMKSISRILEMNAVGAGIKLKINCVVMRGMNEREIVPFVELGREKDIEVRFIEYMPFEGNKWSKKKMISFQEMLELIREKYPNIQKVQGHLNDTSKTYKIPGFVGRIGFITSMTHNFCGTCNRLRITSDGNLKVCLFGNSEVSLRDILRELNDGKPIDAEAMVAIKAIETGRHQQVSSGTSGSFETSAKEAQLLEVIGMAVKRKKEKHAGMGQLENMKNRPMILIDAAASFSPNLNFPGMRLPENLPTMSAYSRNRQMPSSVFMYPQTSNILSHSQQQFKSLVTHSQIRAYRTIRHIPGQSVFRRIPASLPSDEHRPIRKSKNLTRTTTDSKADVDPSLSHSIERSTVDIKAQIESKDESVKRCGNSNGTKKPHSVAGTYTNKANFNDSGKVTRDQLTRKSIKEVLQLSHLTNTGEAHMVNVTDKHPTKRSATAVALLIFSGFRTFKVLKAATQHKGDAIAVARIAGIQAAKKTADLIPLAHPGLGLTGVTINIEPFQPPTRDTPAGRNRLRRMGIGLRRSGRIPAFGGVFIEAVVHCHGKTGVEMEALTAATTTALTLYDMLKGHDKAMHIGGAKVVAKSGGKSGDWFIDRRGRRKVLIGSSAPSIYTSESKIGLGTLENVLRAQGKDASHHEEGSSLAPLQARWRQQQRARLEHGKQKWREDRLRYERKKLDHLIRKFKYLEEKLKTERRKISLASINIDAEIQNAVRHKADSSPKEGDDTECGEENDLVSGIDFAKKRVEHYNEWASCH